MTMWRELRAAWHGLRAHGFDEITLVHGGARGADTLAAAIWSQSGLPVEAHPADWNSFGGDAGTLRNERMVQLGADLCLAFPLGQSTGTRGCMDLAEKAGIPVREVASS